jgi:ATP-dependent DNA ligase
MSELVMLCQRGVWGQFPQGYFYETKLDGTRCLAGKKGNDVRLKSRHNTDYTSKFPEIVADLLSIPYDFVLDGEIVGKSYLSLAGRTHLTDTFKIQVRANTEPCDLYAFDIIFIEGKDIDALYKGNLTLRPLRERKEILYRIGEHGHLKIVKPEPLETLLEKEARGEIEGLVAKEPESIYEFRRSEKWPKFRKEPPADMLIIGYEDSDKPRRPYRSLILRWNGREVQASSGLSEADLRLTSELFAKEPKHKVGTKWYFENPHYWAEIAFYRGKEIGYRFPRVVKLKLEKIEI